MAAGAPNVGQVADHAPDGERSTDASARTVKLDAERMYGLARAIGGLVQLRDERSHLVRRRGVNHARQLHSFDKACAGRAIDNAVHTRGLRRSSAQQR
jgi:hypothetical protein